MTRLTGWAPAVGGSSSTLCHGRPSRSPSWVRGTLAANGIAEGPAARQGVQGLSRAGMPARRQARTKRSRVAGSASGRLHALAAMLPERSPLLPQVPTFAQSGLAAPVTPWGALFGPKGMSGTVVAGRNGEVAAVLRGPALRQRLSDLAFEPRTSSADELARMAADQLSAWRRAAAEAGMSPV